jgi:hypothetical protein
LRLEWLGTEALTWRHLLVIVRQSPADSAIARTLDPEAVLWRLPEHLLAAIFDSLQVLVWQNTEDGQEGRNKPQPLPRPGVQPTAHAGNTYGSGAMTVDQAEAWLAAKNPLQHQKG